MEKTITGQVDFSIEISDKEYHLNYTPTVENELAAMSITREVIKTLKENLLTLEKQAVGKTKNVFRDRINKVTGAEYLLRLLIEEVVVGVLHPPEIKEEKTKESISE